MAKVWYSIGTDIAALCPCQEVIHKTLGRVLYLQAAEKADPPARAAEPTSSPGARGTGRRPGATSGRPGR